MNDTASSPQVAHTADAQRFQLTVEGHQAVLDYRRQGDTLVITHTGVPEAIGGRGIAAQLVKAALEYARANGLKVDPACSYADTFMRRHGEYADLLG